MTLRNITCAVTLCLLTLSGQAVGKTEMNWLQVDVAESALLTSFWQ